MCLVFPQDTVNPGPKGTKVNFMKQKMIQGRENMTAMVTLVYPPSLLLFAM